MIRGHLSGLFSIGLLLLALAPARACGPSFPEPVFSFSKRPENFAAFAQGQIGIVQPSWYRSVLTVAYRALGDLPLSTAEQQAAARVWQGEFEQNDANDQARADAMDAWLAARRQALGATDKDNPSIQVFRGDEGSYEVFLNCPGDAFANAAKTLSARLAAYHRDDFVLAWLQGQDQVFGNCSQGQEAPEEAAADAPDWFKFDRDYQIAAAHFYALRYGEAQTRFQNIAQTEHSPWRPLAKYLLARVAIRQGQWQQAEARLNGVLADAELAPYHASAKQLLNFINYRLHPEQLHAEVAKRLASAGENPRFFQDLSDYRTLLDGASIENTDVAEVKSKYLRYRQDSELTDWVFSMQSTAPDAYGHALERWRASKTPAWLVAALVKAQDGGAESDALIAAADGVPKDSAAFLTTTYHAARLQLAAGKADAARQRLDAVLGDQRLPISQSAHNELFALRLRLARNLDEWVHFAQRQALSFGYDEGNGINECLLIDFKAPVEGEDYAKTERLWRQRSMFDEDATAILNKHTPLTKLKAIALHPAWPDYLKRRLVMSVWLRAVLLGDDALAAEFAPLVGRYLPELKTGMAAYAKAKSAQARHFEAVWLMLKHPGLKPLVEAAQGRLSAFDALDNYRDNWWCDADFDRPASPPPAQGFLTAAEQAKAAEENAKIAGLTGGANYLAQQTAAWADYSPNDRRLPEALHLAVKATRYGCQNCATAKVSKAAFDILQKRFKNSPWRGKTPYWFGDNC